VNWARKFHEESAAAAVARARADLAVVQAKNSEEYARDRAADFGRMQAYVAILCEKIDAILAHKETE